MDANLALLVRDPPTTADTEVGDRGVLRGTGLLQELLATDERRALEFFFVHLKDVCEPAVPSDELLYNASVLAHYAQVSTDATEGVPMFTGLAELFDQFV